MDSFEEVIEAAKFLGAKADKYDELIMAVETKVPDESRHETALRYIRERETHNNHPVSSH